MNTTLAIFFLFVAAAAICGPRLRRLWPWRENVGRRRARMKAVAAVCEELGCLELAAVFAALGRGSEREARRLIEALLEKMRSPRSARRTLDASFHTQVRARAARARLHLAFAGDERAVRALVAEANVSVAPPAGSGSSSPEPAAIEPAGGRTDGARRRPRLFDPQSPNP